MSYSRNEKKFCSPLTAMLAKRNYQQMPSILAHLPWIECDDESKSVLLHDKTVGAVFEVSMVATEGKPEWFLLQLRDGLQGLFQDTFPQYSDTESPWIVQTFVEEEYSMMYLYDAVSNYIQPTAKNSPFTETYLALVKKHCEWLSQKEGVFHDDKVTDCRFHGGQRKVRMVIYRQYSKTLSLQRGRTSLQDLNQVAASFMSKLKGVGIRVERLEGTVFRNWLVRWFNPQPAMANGDSNALIKLLPEISKEEHPYSYDFAEQLFYSVPESNAEEGIWYFDKLPHRYMAIQQLSKVPSIGQLTLERNFGAYRYGLFDKFPAGSCFVMTVVIQSQEAVKQHLARIEEGARKSRSTAADITFEDCQIAKTAIEKSNYLFPASMGVYLRGNHAMDLAEKEIQLQALLINNGFHALKGDHELVPLHAYVNQLPFCYNYNFDKQYLYRSNYVFGKQLANVLPLYGRERGTEHPLFQFLNRSGESLCIDPFNPEDKDNNSHLFIMGSTGSGKSALSIDLLIKLMGTYRPYLLMVDAGNSFHLLADYFAEQGLSVHHIAITLDNPPILNPFVNSEAMLAQIDSMGDEHQAIIKIEAQLEADSAEIKLNENKKSFDNDSTSRDYMGEMALAAQLMITGVEKKEQEKLSRQNRMLILEPLVRGARAAKANGFNQMIAKDVVNSLNQMALELEQQQREPDKQNELRSMADSMEFFTKDPLSSRIFNRRGTAWPDADVILFEQGTFKDEGYEAPNALAFMGLMSLTMSKAEQRQSQERFTVVFGDEIHTLTKNVLTVIYLTKCAKMSRKFGLWLWLATQHISDFPAEAKKILSMMEFWLCLGMSEADIQAIAEFRQLSEEEKSLFRSVRKAAKKFVEGILLCPRIKDLFRNVPPRLPLALAMTEKHEKAERRKLMEEFQISELEAAKQVAAQMEN